MNFGARAPFLRRSFADAFVRLDFYFYLGSGLEFDFVAVFIHQLVWDSEFAVEMIGSFDRDLRFFRFIRTGMRLDYLFDCTRQFCAGFSFLSVP